MKKTLSILLLAVALITLPGCSCDRQDPEEIPELEIEVHPPLQEDPFVGPTTQPFSNGPSELPPTEN